jgi:hypothetical protein
MSVVMLKAEYSRRFPDPNFKGVERQVLYCRAAGLPADLPLDANPRAQNLDRWVYKDVKKSLINKDETEPNSFHLKNKGLTIICDRIVQLDEKGTFRLHFDHGPDARQGVVDGGHTYKIILEAIEEGICPEDQFVKVEVLQGVDPDWAVFIAGGLNTSMQVQTMSLAKLQGKYAWIEETLNSEPFGRKIAYRENEKNADEKPYDVRDLISWLVLFNIGLYPNDGNMFPVKAYTSKEAVLDEYLDNIPLFEKMRPILPDIMRLHDLLQVAALKGHNEAGGHAGKLAFVWYRDRGEHSLTFIGRRSKSRLYDGALYPMLGAFRWMVVEDSKTGLFAWRPPGFDSVRAVLDKVAGRMMASTKDVSDKTGRNPNAIGKNRSHWENLYRTVAMEQMRLQMNARKG